MFLPDVKDEPRPPLARLVQHLYLDSRASFRKEARDVTGRVVGSGGFWGTHRNLGGTTDSLSKPWATVGSG